MQAFRLKKNIFNKNYSKQKYLLAGGLALTGAGLLGWFMADEKEASDKSKYHGVVIFGVCSEDTILFCIVQEI
jgi:hypothetical protein